MLTERKYRFGWIAIGLALLGLSLNCGGFSILQQQPPVDPTHTCVVHTPTPHSTPISGIAFVYSSDEDTLLLEKPNITSDWKGQILAGTQVEIIQSLWYYEQHRYGETHCYMYYVRIPGTQIEGWLPHDRLTKEKRGRPPVEYLCFDEGLPTPTPPHAPLSGLVYVNVGEGYGVASSYDPDPREHVQAIFAHGVQVNILDPLWVRYDANEVFSDIACYMYFVRLSNSSGMTWLPEDVLSKELTDTPRPDCFPSQTPPTIFKISPTPPPDFKLFTPGVMKP
jgi:hypothetical protein